MTLTHKLAGAPFSRGASTLARIDADLHQAGIRRVEQVTQFVSSLLRSVVRAGDGASG
jgi:hypothetical protein